MARIQFLDALRPVAAAGALVAKAAQVVFALALLVEVAKAGDVETGGAAVLVKAVGEAIVDAAGAAAEVVVHQVASWCCCCPARRGGVRWRVEQDLGGARAEAQQKDDAGEEPGSRRSRRPAPHPAGPFGFRIENDGMHHRIWADGRRSSPLPAGWRSCC